MARPWPAVAVFAPLDEERWIPREEQEAIVAVLEQALAPHTSAQFLCTEAAGLPRAAVLVEYLTSRVQRGRLGPPAGAWR